MCVCVCVRVCVTVCISVYTCACVRLYVWYPPSNHQWKLLAWFSKTKALLKSSSTHIGKRYCWVETVDETLFRPTWVTRHRLSPNSFVPSTFTPTSPVSRKYPKKHAPLQALASILLGLQEALRLLQGLRQRRGSLLLVSGERLRQSGHPVFGLQVGFSFFWDPILGVVVMGAKSVRITMVVGIRRRTHHYWKVFWVVQDFLHPLYFHAYGQTKASQNTSAKW